METKELTAAQVALLQAWQQKKEAIRELQDAEYEMRMILWDVLKPSDFQEGSRTLVLNTGAKVELKAKLNYKITADKLDSLKEVLWPIRGGVDLFAELFSWHPELSLKAYRGTLPFWLSSVANDKQREKVNKLMADILTITPATPSIALK